MSSQSPNEKSSSDELRMQTTSSGSENTKPETVHEEFDDEAVRKGLIYPPPPSFYLRNQQESLSKAPSPVTEKSATPIPDPPGPSAPSFSGDAWREWSTPPSAPVAAPSPIYGRSGSSTNIPSRASGPGYYYPYRPPQRQSQAWIWVLVIVVTSLILAACVLFAYMSMLLANSSSNGSNFSISGSTQVAEQYYRAIQEQDYQAAYAFLHTSISEQAFIEQAQQLDQSNGSVLNYQIGIPNAQEPHAIITVTVERLNGDPYTARLTLERIEGRWKIVEYSSI